MQTDDEKLQALKDDLMGFCSKEFRIEKNQDIVHAYCPFEPCLGHNKKQTVVAQIKNDCKTYKAHIFKLHLKNTHDKEFNKASTSHGASEEVNFEASTSHQNGTSDAPKQMTYNDLIDDLLKILIESNCV